MESTQGKNTNWRRGLSSALKAPFTLPGKLYNAGATKNNNANVARRNRLRAALQVYVNAAQGNNTAQYIQAARALNVLLVEPTKGNREYAEGLGAMRVAPGTTPEQIRRAINARLSINRTKFLQNALVKNNVTNQNLKNIFGPNVNLSHRIFKSRFRINLNSARNLNNLNKLRQAIPKGMPNQIRNAYLEKIANKEEKIKAEATAKARNNTRSSRNASVGPNRKGNGPKGNGNGPKGNGNGPKGNGNKPNGNGNKPNGNGRGGGAITTTGIGKLKIQVGTGNNNLRRRIENLERAAANAQKAKVNSKNANKKANSNPNNAEAAKAAANALRAELEASRKELAASRAAVAAAEAAKANLQGKLANARATGVNVEGLRKAYAAAEAAAVSTEEKLKSKISELQEQAAAARRNANAARANAANKNATIAEHLAAKTAAEEAVARALAEKEALATEHALKEEELQRVSANKTASNAARNAALAEVEASKAREKEAATRVREANAARLSATAKATEATEQVAAKIQSLEAQLANVTRQKEANAARIAELQAQGVNTEGLRATAARHRANANRLRVEANSLRRQLAVYSTVSNVAGLVGSGLSTVAGWVAAGSRAATDPFFRNRKPVTPPSRAGNNNAAKRRRVEAERLAAMRLSTATGTGTVTSIPFRPGGSIIAQEGYGRSTYGPQQLVNTQTVTQNNNPMLRFALRNTVIPALMKEFTTIRNSRNSKNIKVSRLTELNGRVKTIRFPEMTRNLRAEIETLRATLSS